MHKIYRNRFQENDEITEDDYSKLSEAGFSRQIVDTYLNGLRNDGAGEVDAQGIRDSVGGDESYLANGFLGYRKSTC